MQAFVNEEVLLFDQNYPVADFDRIAINWHGDPKVLYTLMMYYLDAPTGIYLHLLVVNIPGFEVANGTVVVPYQSAEPPTVSTHRYVYQVFRQAAPVKVFSQVRTNFDLNSFITNNQLTAVD